MNSSNSQLNSNLWSLFLQNISYSSSNNLNSDRLFSNKETSRFFHWLITQTTQSCIISQDINTQPKQNVSKSRESETTTLLNQINQTEEKIQKQDALHYLTTPSFSLIPSNNYLSSAFKNIQPASRPGFSNREILLLRKRNSLLSHNKSVLIQQLKEIQTETQRLSGTFRSSLDSLLIQSNNLGDCKNKYITTAHNIKEISSTLYSQQQTKLETSDRLSYTLNQEIYKENKNLSKIFYISPQHFLNQRNQFPEQSFNAPPNLNTRSSSFSNTSFMVSNGNKTQRTPSQALILRHVSNAHIAAYNESEISFLSDSIHLLKRHLQVTINLRMKTIPHQTQLQVMIQLLSQCHPILRNA